MSAEKMSHGQNVTGQNVTRTKCHRTICHRTICHRTKCHNRKCYNRIWTSFLHLSLSKFWMALCCFSSFLLPVCGFGLNSVSGIQKWHPKIWYVISVTPIPPPPSHDILKFSRFSASIFLQSLFLYKKACSVKTFSRVNILAKIPYFPLPSTEISLFLPRFRI